MLAPGNELVRLKPQTIRADGGEKFVVEEEARDTGDALVFRGSLTEEDVVSLQRYRDMLLIRRPFRTLAKLVAATMGIVMIWFMVEEGWDSFAALFLAGCAYVFILPVERRWRARRFFRQNPDNHLETEAQLTASRVSIADECHQTVFAWKLLTGVMDTPEGVMFYAETDPVLWLPARWLDGYGYREQVLGLACDNGIPVTQP
jgi:hypothetical protein